MLISDSVFAQGFFVASALQLTNNLHQSSHVAQPQLWLAEPSSLDPQTARSHDDSLDASSAALDRVNEQSRAVERQADGTMIRVAALKRADGSFVVAIEAMQADGSWGPRQLPQRRVVPANAPHSTWLVSSELELHSADAEEGPLFCVVTHGGKQDRYWTSARAYMHISAHLTDTNWRYEAHLDGADQAAAIDQCSADGAAVIASTLADPEAVTDSLLAARAAGARIVTFNSGGGFRRSRRLGDPRRPQ